MAARFSLGLFLVLPGKMIIAIVREAGQRVMIEIIKSMNDENDGRPLSYICSMVILWLQHLHTANFALWHCCTEWKNNWTVINHRGSQICNSACFNFSWCFHKGVLGQDWKCHTFLLSMHAGLGLVEYINYSPDLSGVYPENNVSARQIEHCTCTWIACGPCTVVTAVVWTRQAQLWLQ